MFLCFRLSVIVFNIYTSMVFYVHNQKKISSKEPKVVKNPKFEFQKVF